MGKITFAITSLVAAIPAGFLGYLVVMAFLNQFEHLPVMLSVVLGFTLLICLLVVAAPVAILLGPSPEPRRMAGAAMGGGNYVQDEDVDESGLPPSVTAEYAENNFETGMTHEVEATDENFDYEDDTFGETREDIFSEDDDDAFGETSDDYFDEGDADEFEDFEDFEDER
ncbi:hypothetical protein [Calycomorphotria hydatis]|uniref:Uncharacterized protein n=1 Tax=Calycomorphotria hydatis TaxID=2528027 RepID=A0A517T4F5_9PLAN|nr:hypothetical protein [Calycomorphotria hydatis]QDT63259.1 hypothetical protein V22_04780 [Calycomorphotria hydatis]